MKKEEIKIGGVYKCLSNGTIFEVLDINDKTMKWITLNRKKYNDYAFNDAVTKIKFYDLVELKNYEKD